MDEDEVQAPYCIEQRQHPRAWGSRAWKRGRRYGDDDGGCQGRHAEQEDGARDHEEGARLQALHNDAANAAAATAAAAGAAAPATPPPPGEVTPEALALERRKQEIWMRRRTRGVPVSCEQIAAMDAHELEEWALANINGI